MVLCRTDEECRAYPTLQNTVKVAIDRSEAENIEVCFNHFPPGCVGREHVHDGRLQVYYVVTGTGEATIDDETIKLKPGMIVYVPRGVKHSTKADPEQELMYVVFNAFSPSCEELQSSTFAEHYEKVKAEIEAWEKKHGRQDTA